MSDPSRETLQQVAREASKWLRYYRSLGFSHLSPASGFAAQAAGQPASGGPREQGPSEQGMPLQPSLAPMDCLSRGAEGSLVVEEDGMPRRDDTSAGKLFSVLRSEETLAAIRKDLGEDCRRCKLSGGRKTIVFGSGNEKAGIVFVGEGPGADEDEQGVPFVGRAGQLLTDMIEKGLRVPRSEVYICNIVKCRPPQNRKPELDEVAACRPFVERQIRAIRPKAICALGATAAETLLGMKESMGRLRGKQYEFAGIPLVVTYHPAFLLRDPSRKADAWADLKLLMAILKEAR